jgi:hypothetical protein
MAEPTVPRWELEEARRERDGMQALAIKNRAERNALRKRVEALEAQRDEALKVLGDLEVSKWEAVAEARRILSGERDLEP